MSLKYILYLLSMYTPILPLLFGYKKWNTLLWWYVMAGFATDMIGGHILKPMGITIEWLSNLYMLVNFVLLALYVGKPLNKSKQYKLYIVTGIFSLIFIIYCIQHSVLLFNGLGMSMLNFICVLFGIYALYCMLEELKIEKIQESEYFWANVSFIIYYSGNFLLFLFHDYLLAEKKEILILLWAYILFSMNILDRLILTVALTRKKP